MEQELTLLKSTRVAEVRLCFTGLFGLEKLLTALI